MKIALIGYGKMGKTIEGLALGQNHEIVLRIDRDHLDHLSQLKENRVDVAIEFSRPEAAVNNILACFEHGVPVVSGTTGWTDKMEEIHQTCRKKEGAFFYASNFSIGVYLFSRINAQLAQMMNQQSDYEVQMEEIHHTQKLDAPSGTAISLAQDILQNVAQKERWVNEATEQAEELAILSKRIDQVPGTHKIQWQSEIDSITIEHVAHSRIGFAKGAIAAAEWLVGKKGVFGMQDLLGF
ncbi:MAG: 4-hydroxy-tetrahydrodipicolinate reductase [Bacteroidota bacterium]